MMSSPVEGLEARLATLREGIVDMSTTEGAVERAQVSHASSWWMNSLNSLKIDEWNPSDHLIESFTSVWNVWKPSQNSCKLVLSHLVTRQRRGCSASRCMGGSSTEAYPRWQGGDCGDRISFQAQFFSSCSDKSHSRKGGLANIRMSVKDEKYWICILIYQTNINILYWAYYFPEYFFKQNLKKKVLVPLQSTPVETHCFKQTGFF